MAFFRKRPKAARIAEDTSGQAAETVTTPGALAPSPNPATNLLLAEIALRGGSALLKRAVEAGLRGGAGKGPGKDKDKGGSLGQNLVGTMLARVATRSVPGALIVGGGLLAKTLYDRKRGRAAPAPGTGTHAGRTRQGRR